MVPAQRCDLSFHNAEVRVYAVITLPAVPLSRLIMIFLQSDFNFMYGALLQSVALTSFY
ncbi:hypothetical protein [Sporosarcina sp. P7]|uniref:hypothetical protein n=1 Tax=Sporosarcina sp. P7 TaxID=2048244 RepID=UPI0013042ECE|nr:hypothetical protein [Sporosarcina sp. P7]